MSLLSSLFKSSRKTNLTPNIEFKTPAQANPEMYGSLSNLAKRRIQAGYTGEKTPGVGFGDDFVDKTTNPVADSMRRNFRNVTAPTISSEYSKRGLGRSSLAATTQGLAEGNVESDIGNLMAKFFALNEAQKKSDTSEGINVGQNILNQDISQSNQIASASERLANATAADARARESADVSKAGNIMQAGAQLVAPVGGAFTNIANMFPATSQIGGFMKSIGSGMTDFSNATQAKVAGYNQNQIQALLQALAS